MTNIQPSLQIPPGYGFDLIPKAIWEQQDEEEAFFDHLHIWEPPRPEHKYVLGVDVSNGVGLDRSVIEVLRVGTMKEPDEQVAQYISDTIDPIDLAYIIDPVGRFYKDPDGYEALAAIETNGPGIATQGELQRHLGYSNFYVWQYEDSRDPRRRYSSKIGWSTTWRTRPLMLTRFLKAISTVDPTTGYPDLRINSPFTISELRDFYSDGPVYMAEAAPGAHDDSIIAISICSHVAQTLHFEDNEPLSETRRRMAEERARQAAADEQKVRPRDFQNTDATLSDMNEDMGVGDGAEWYWPYE